MIDLVERGSKTAKDGFRNEQDVVDIFNNWKTNKLAQEWLIAMNYKLDDIEDVLAVKIKRNYKADIQVQIKVSVKLKTLIDCQNLQIKLVSNNKGFNQIDKRWLKNYKELWDIPSNVYKILEYYTGEKLPSKANTRDKRRMFINEMPPSEQEILLSWLNEKKYLIVSDILKGRGQFSAEWVLVIQKIEKSFNWSLQPINKVMNHYSSGEILITASGNIRLGKITIQRKGGDNGRDTAKMLQFKIDPTEIMDID